METFEYYISEFISNAKGVTYEGSSTYAEIRRSNDRFLREEELSLTISESFSDRITDVASYLDDKDARVRRSIAYLLLGKMNPPDEIAKIAIRVLEDYANAARGDETLMARGFLLAYGSKHRTNTRASDDVSLMSTLKKKYISD